MAAAAAAGASLAGSKPNPSANGPGLRPPGKPVALADITNTERPNPSRSINVGDVLKENTKLVHLLGEKTKIIEISSAEMHKLRFALHATRQQNLHLAQTNSQILAELNQGKDRLKALQHELACATTLLKVKGSELEQKNRTADQLQKEVTSQEIKTAPSKLAPVKAHQADNKATSDNAHHSVQTQSALPSNTVREEPPPDKTNKRHTNKWNLESCEGTKNSKTVQHSYKPDLQSTGSLHHEYRRNTLWRRSSRLNPGSCETAEVSCETLHKDTVVPSASSSLNVPKLREPNNGKDTQKSMQDELVCNAAVHKVKVSDLEKNEINKQPPKEVSVEEEIQEARSRVAGAKGLEANQIDDKATDTNPNHLAETQPSLPFNIQHPEPPQERATKRGANKRKLESCEGQKDSNIEEDINANFQSTSSEPLHHEQTRNPLRRKSSRLNPGSCEVTKGTLEAAQEDTIAPLAPPSSNPLIEQSKREKQNDCRSSMESSEEQATRRSSVQVTGRRSSVRAAGKAFSYKEMPLNVKMRRP